jgi:hypothetical protein
LRGLPEIVEHDRITGEDCFIARAHVRRVVEIKPEGYQMSSRAIVQLAAAIAVYAVSTASMAQNCMQYPEGRERFNCAKQKHPALQDKLERCKDQARQMGLTPGKGDPNDVRGFVRGCMHRPG